MHTLEIRATATGPNFYYRETHEWGYGSDEGTQWVLDAIQEMGELATALAADGKGNITGEFLTVVDGEATSLKVEKLSKKDVAKIERAFYSKALELVAISESK
jgi:hypothetical protein